MNIEIPAFSEKPESEQLESLRETAGLVADSMLRQGAEPQVISYALAYIATEMGLYLSDNSHRVFPFILEGIANAARTVKPMEEARTPSSADENVINFPTR
jgi:hypothetical protein